MLNHAEAPLVRLVVKEIDPILRMPAVKKAIGLSRPTIYRYVAKGVFPPPLALGPGAVGWRQSTVEAWLESRSTTRT